MGHTESGLGAYWQEMVIRAFRIPIRIALRLAHPSLQDLQNLMRAAIIRELRSDGLSYRQMALTLDVSPTWIWRLVQRERAIGDAANRDAFLARVIERLRQGPATAGELNAILPFGAAPSMGALTLGLLMRAEIVEEIGRRRRTYRLTPRFAGEGQQANERPLGTLEAELLLAMRILETPGLREGISQEALGQALGLDPTSPALLGGLAWLKEEGALDVTSEGVLILEGSHLQLTPEDGETRVRTGLLHFLERIRVGMDVVLKAPESALFGQRTLLFEAGPEALRSFIHTHRERTLDALEDLPSQGTGDERRCQITWLISHAEDQP